MTLTDTDIGQSVAPMEPLAKLTKEIRAVSGEMDREQARSLVELYYRWQEHRLALMSQERALDDARKPTAVVAHFATQVSALERQMVTVLDRWTMESEVGRWSRSVKGIGPVIAAGLLAHIDITRAPTVGHIWRFAGLDPTVKWGKGQRRPWNADLKVLCWKLGDSFVKVSGGDNPGFYGVIYRERKAQEIERNEAKAFADQAAASLLAKKITDAKLRATYEAGMLPPGRIDLRARRYAVKLLLSHWHHVAYVAEYGIDPPKPYVLTEAGGHAHFIPPPGL